jgi:hypothetical protein
MSKGIVSLDKGFYHEARAKGIAPLTYLTDLVKPEPPEIAAVESRVFARYRQKDDDSASAQALRQYAYDLCGLEKEFAARGIRTRGPMADTVEKLFVSSNDTPLFPAFLASQIIAGILAASLVPRLSATEVRINSHVAEKITLSDTAADRTLKWIGEGVDLPKTTIRRAEGNITLYKYGRLLEVSYESVRLMHLDILGLFLQRMGMQIGIDQTDDAIETLIAGDGTSGSAVVDTDAEVSGTLDYDELVRLRLAFPIGYDMTDAVVNDANLRTILNMPEFKDPLAGMRFQQTGEFVTPMGAKWHRWTSTGSASFSTDRILAVDNRGALAIFREDTLLEESDRLIDKQLERRAMSEWVGWMKLDNNAAQCLDIVA